MASTIFNAGAIKLLKSKLRFKDSNVEIITNESFDPTVVAVNAPAGSIFIRTTGEVYIKNTSGNNTDFRTIADEESLNAHINALTDAHDASAISNVPSGNLVATDVQGALNELQSDVDNRALDSIVIKKDGSVDFTANQSMGGFQLTGLAAGSASSHAINKGQFDAALEGLKPKAAARVATTADIVIATALNAGDVLDGVTLANGDRVLVKDQTAAEENGIYVVSATPTRATDFDSLTPVDEVNGALIAIQEGSANAGKVFVQSGTVAVLNTDPINFVFFNSVATLVGGDGITISGTNISVDHDGQGIQFVADQLSLELDGSTLTKSASGLKVSDATLSAKANVALDNLSPTSINQSLTPSTNATLDLGGGSNRWRKLFAATVDNSSGVIIDTNAQALTDAGALIALWSATGVTMRPNRFLTFKSPDNVSTINLQGPPNGTPNATYTLPPDGSAGQVLQTNGAGVLTFANQTAAYTDEQAQDAVGNILVDSSKIDFTYNDATPSITATIVAGSLVDADINAAAAIAATKIGTGTVDNTEFGYLNGVTSAIQTQLNNKATTTLDNVASTAVSDSLVAGINNIFDLGSTNLRWANVWADTSVRSPSHTVIGNGGGNGTVNGELRAVNGVEATDGIALAVGLINGTFGRTGIITAANATANATATGNVLVGTGNKTAGTGNSGSIIIQTGTSAGGTRGTINLVDASLAAASVGDVWALTNTTTGAGTWTSSINATKIGNGDVDNTELSYLNGVTSSIQDQLNNKLNQASLTSTSLADANAVLTGAQMVGGLFTITPTAARTLTTDTAVNIISAFSGSVDNNYFLMTITSFEQTANLAYDTTLVAGVGVTIIGKPIINNGASTFIVRRLTSTTVEITRADSSVGRFNNGATTTPSISFTDDPDTGIFRAGTNRLGFSTGGVQNLQVSTTEINALLPNRQQSSGSAAAPGYSWMGDDNTGLFLVNADILGISAGGILRSSISTSAITNTIPILNSAGTAAAPTYTFSGSADTGLFRSAVGVLGIAASGVSRVTIQASGANFSVPIAMGGNAITGLLNPVAAQDAATKSYVDTVAGGVTTKVNATNASMGSNVTNEVITGLTFAHASFNGCYIDYRIKKGTLVRTGRILVSTDGTNVAFNDVFVETVTSTVVFEAVVNGANINIRHTNTETGTMNISFEQSLFAV